MTARLPPLRAIEIFVAAGRRLSFTEAAKAVNLTPSAVSRRVRDLETELGTALFRRFNRRLELTAAGAQYLEAMSRALDLVRQESDAVRPKGDARRLRLSTVPLVGAWLMPRLARMKTRRPDFEVEVTTSGALVELGDGRFDAAVRFGEGRWPGLVAHRLFDLVALPVAAPGLFPARRPVSAAALEATTLLQVGGAPQLWGQWLAAVGLAGYRPPRVQSFDSAHMMREAAISGLGVALAHAEFVEEHLAAGRLIEAFSDPPVVMPGGYYLVYPPASRDHPVLRALRRELMPGRRVS